jgi:hypothetical protein
MGTDDQGRRYTWGDVRLDEVTETVSTPGTFEGLALEDLPPPPGYAPLSVWWLSLFVVFWLLVPAAVILAYRIALP